MRVAWLLVVSLFVGACAWEDGHGMKIHKKFRVGTQSPASDAITLVLQCDIERMDAVKRHAQEWDGPISLAVLIYSESDVDKVKTKLDSYDDPATRHVTTHIVLSSEDANAFYPINKMRNIALENIDTKWTYVLDMDESTVSNMATHKASLETARSNVDESSTVFAVPSFEWAGKEHGGVPKDRGTLKGLFNKQVVIKHAHFIKAYLGKFDVGKWMDSDQPISVKYADKFEPYFIAEAGKRVHFEDQFVGFGNNKAQLHFQLATSGMKFLALPNVFNFANECYEDYKWQYEKRDTQQSVGVANKFWKQIGEEHGCNECEPFNCIEKCPWLIDGGASKAVLVQASTPTDPNLAVVDTEKGTLEPLDAQSASLTNPTSPTNPASPTNPTSPTNLAAVDLEKGAAAPREPQSDTQPSAPVDNAKASDPSRSHSLAIPVKSAQGEPRVAPPVLDTTKPSNDKETPVQEALVPSM